MSKRESISRCNLIIKKLRRVPSTFDEIADYLSRESELQSYDFNVSKRTFQRDLEDIRSLFNLDIQYDYSRRVYFINDEGQPDANNRMLEAFDMFNSLNMVNDLSQYIHFEKRKPQGTEHFYGLLHAIKNRFIIRFSYQKFWDDELSQRVAEPYMLKEFKSRWYLLAKDRKDNKLKTFGLDRILALDITREKFKEQHLNTNEMFKNCFGIINPDDSEPEEIILSFTHFKGKYIKSFPLYETQQILIDNEKELRIKLTLFITEDFIPELLSYGDEMKVISPAILKDRMRKVYASALKKNK